MKKTLLAVCIGAALSFPVVAEGGGKVEISPELLDKAAEAAHEANRLYCASIGDTSQPSWAKAPDWQKDSARAGVRQIYDNPETTPEQSHESWMAAKLADGWVYGEAKDAEAKTHPCLVPYSELPEPQRMKDEIFGKTVRAIVFPVNAPVAEPVEPDAIAARHAAGKPVVATIAKYNDRIPVQLKSAAHLEQLKSEHGAANVVVQL